MNLLAVIPARGGSKGIPHKNVKDMNGKPLLAYTTDVVLKRKKLFKKIIVSTEDKKIADISKRLGIDVPFLRPIRLASDTSASVDLVKHAILTLEKDMSIKFDAVMLLQPTNPLRTPEDIDKSLKIFQEFDCDSVISVSRTISHHPAYMKKINSHGYLTNYAIAEKEGMRRQDFKPYAYFRDGSIYLTKRNVVINKNSLWGEKIKPYIIPEERAVGIDNMLDWYLCETLLSKPS